jgi:hypothetical protein
MTTVIFPRPEDAPTLPGLNLEQTADRNSSHLDQQPHAVAADKLTLDPQPAASKHGAQHRILSHDEWIQFCRGVGVLKDDESAVIVRPRFW